MDKNEPEAGDEPVLEDGRGSFNDDEVTTGSTGHDGATETSDVDERPPPPPPVESVDPPDPPPAPPAAGIGSVTLGDGNNAGVTEAGTPPSTPSSSAPSSSVAADPIVTPGPAVDTGRTQAGGTGLIDLGEAIADERDRERPAAWKYALALGLPVIVAIGLIALLASRGDDDTPEFTVGESTEIATGADVDLSDASAPGDADSDLDSDENVVGILSDAEPADDVAPEAPDASDTEAAPDETTRPDPATNEPAEPVTGDAEREPEARDEDSPETGPAPDADATSGDPGDADDAVEQAADEPDLQPTEAPEPEPEPEPSDATDADSTTGTTGDSDSDANDPGDSDGQPQDDGVTSVVRAITNIDGFAELYELSAPVGDPYDAYKRVTDDTESFSASVPTSFTFINGAPDANGLKLIAAEAEGTALSQPSLTIEVFDEGSVDEILAENGPAFLAECTVLTGGYELPAPAEYEGLLFADEIQGDDGTNGSYIYYESCQFVENSALIQVVLRNPDGKIARIQAFVLTVAELEMLDQVLASLDF